MPNLFSPVQRRINLLAAIEENEGELTPELEEALAINDDDIAGRTQELVELRNQAQVQIMAAEAEQERLAALVKSSKRTVGLIDTQLLDAVKRVGGTITAGTWRVGTRASSAVLIEDAEQLPATLLRYVAPVDEKYVPDLVAIKKELTAGKMVDGAKLENRVNLFIK